MSIKLWCLDDKGGWGRDLYTEASSRGQRWDPYMFDSILTPNCKGADYVFMRINQGGVRMHQELALAHYLFHKSQKLIPCFHDLLMYESKIKQVRAYAKWMPETHLIFSLKDADKLIGQLGYPFVSKSSTGSASCNVRLLTSKEEALKEAEAVFGDGLTAPHKLGEKIQRGYLIWQEFLPGNEYDYRVCKIGNTMMMLRRFNKPGTYFASGSGKNEPVNELDPESASALEFAGRFFKETGTKWCGIDLVERKYGGQNEWRLLETTIGWSQKAYHDCVFFGTPYKGHEIWKLTCDCIEQGVFN